MVDGISGISAGTSIETIKEIVQEAVEEALEAKDAGNAAGAEQSADEESTLVDDAEGTQQASGKTDSGQNGFSGFSSILTSITTMMTTIIETVLKSLGAGQTDQTADAGNADGTDSAGDTSNITNETIELTKEEKHYLKRVIANMKYEKLYGKPYNPNDTSVTFFQRSNNSHYYQVILDRIKDEEIQAYAELHSDTLKQDIAAAKYNW